MANQEVQNVTKLSFDRMIETPVGQIPLAWAMTYNLFKQVTGKSNLEKAVTTFHDALSSRIGSNADEPICSVVGQGNQITAFQLGVTPVYGGKYS